MKEHEKYMQKAIELATENIKNGGGPFGAVIVKDKEIVGEGANSVTLINDPTAHAEVMAIRDACKNTNGFNLKGSVIYTSCEPCPMCLSAIYWSRIENVYYGNSRLDAENIGFSDAYIYEQVALPIEQRDISFAQLCNTHAIKSFKDWETFDTKTPY